MRRWLALSLVATALTGCPLDPSANADFERQVDPREEADMLAKGTLIRLTGE